MLHRLRIVKESLVDLAKMAADVALHIERLYVPFRVAKRNDSVTESVAPRAIAELELYLCQDQQECQVTLREQLNAIGAGFIGHLRIGTSLDLCTKELGQLRIYKSVVIGVICENCELLIQRKEDLAHLCLLRCVLDHASEPIFAVNNGSTQHV